MEMMIRSVDYRKLLMYQHALTNEISILAPNNGGLYCILPGECAFLE